MRSSHVLSVVLGKQAAALIAVGAGEQGRNAQAWEVKCKDSQDVEE
jgi:hypothetical protein